MASPDQGYERLGGKQGTLNFSLFARGSTFGGFYKVTTPTIWKSTV